MKENNSDIKQLHQLSNVEKAVLLFDLFVEEMPALISFATQLAKSILNNPVQLQTKAVDQIHTTDFWMELVSNAKTVFDQNGTKLNKDRRLFSEQLFDGYQSIYAIYCLHQYLANEASVNKKLKDAIRLFFF